MLNGKFFTGLPPKMIDRSGGGLNRQQTNFFWPDDTQNQSAVESKVRRRASIQADCRDAYVPRAEQSNSDAENKERFKKEFTRSSIQFYDNVEQTPLRRTRTRAQQAAAAPPQKPQNVEPPVNTSGKRKEAFSSKIQFYDYSEDLNNVPRTDKNNKVEVERNTKNSPKLQNKNLAFDPLPPADEAINFIENDVRNMRITAPPRRRNTVRENRPTRRRDDHHYSDFTEDYYQPPRRLPLPPPPVRARYPESDPDFDEYSPRRLPVVRRPAYYDNDNDPVDYIDPRSERHHYEVEAVSHRKTGRQVHFTYSDNAGDYSPATAPPPQQTTGKVNILKVDNDIRNNEHRPTSPPSAPDGGPSQQHLRSNICFSDTESGTPPPPFPPKRNIRSTAVNKVSVGLPD